MVRTPPPSVARAAHVVRVFVFDHTVFALGALFVTGCVAVGALGWVQVQQTNEARALNEARHLATALTEFRTLYTAEVVRPALISGLEVTHDYRAHTNAIPLPATLSIELGERIGRSESGAKAALYSPYPFPWREDTGGLRDGFQRAAWAALQTDPTREYYELVDRGGVASLRFAVADRMRADCVHCHNTHPQSPRDGWSEGDVRGVLEVSIPMGSVNAASREGVLRTTGLLAGVGVLVLLGLAVSIGRLRRDAVVLEETVTQRTAEVRRLASNLLTAESQERERIALVLHDNLQQLVVAARMRTEAVAARVEGSDQSDLHDVIETLKLVTTESRALSADLDPPLLRQEGLAAAMELLVSQMEARHGLRIEARIDVLAEPSSEVARFVLRAARELLFNIVKHAECNRAELTLRGVAHRCQLEVLDHGTGFDLHPDVSLSQGGLGLPALRQRAQWLGGELQVESRTGSGTSVRISVPPGDAWRAPPPTGA